MIDINSLEGINYMVIAIPDSDGDTFLTNINLELNAINDKVETDPSFGASPAHSITSEEVTVLSNTTGVNTGDETALTIETKLGVSSTNITALSNLTNTNSGDQSLSGLMVKANNLSDVASQQDALNNVTNVAGASNEQLMTKDTATGDAIFKDNPSEPALATSQYVLTPGLSDSGSSGSATFSQLFKKVNYKNVIIYCESLVGESTYTFPTPFTHIPSIVNTPISSIVTLVTTTGITITGTDSTGFIELVGF